MLEDHLDYRSLSPEGNSGRIRLFLGGDVMTGRGIDQILPSPGDPVLHESYMKSAKGYVKLAEKVNGNIPYPADFFYIWGDALGYWEKMAPDLKIINLETAVTRSNRFWENKAVNYRMSPGNISVLKKADIDFCSMANNHVLDFHGEGLMETMKSLRDMGISFSGCGEDLRSARNPAVLEIQENKRVIILSIGMKDSGIPESWEAGDQDPGVFLVSPCKENAYLIQKVLDEIEQPGDIIIISIHWGSNWGYQVPAEHIHFAHDLIDIAGADIIHGHSSHHILGIEVYRNRLILYGCGDFINDYEGISGYESFRDDLTLMYFADLDAETGKLDRLQMIPLQIKKFRLNKTSDKDIKWLSVILNREGRKYGTSVEVSEYGVLNLNW
jgi:poly-gamma-glutamate synthesis protein (capsule biosynthesis protein)